MCNFKFFIITLFVPLFLTGQVQEVDPPTDVKTISLGVVDNASGLAIINLNDRLVLEFDVLINLEEDFYYVIEHFDSDWNPSQLMKTEYLAGMDNLRIVDYVNSFNTYQIYSHYRLQIPNQQTRLRVSGNYIIKILYLVFFFFCKIGGFKMQGRKLRRGGLFKINIGSTIYKEAIIQN